MRIKPYSIEIIKSDGFEHNWEKYYKLKPGDVFVEVGAFWGRYALVANKRKCSKIILIEPSPENIATIEYLVIKEKLKSVEVVKKAIGNKREIMKFDISGNPSGHCMDDGNSFVSSTRKESLMKNNVIIENTQVQVDTLDNILTELNIDHVDLLSSDCEGEEAHMLEGAERYLNEKRIKNITIGAYHHPDICRNCVEILKNKDYKNIVYEDGVIYSNI